MTPEAIIRAYDEGKLTSHDCALRVITETDLSLIDNTLAILPSSIQSALVEYVTSFEVDGVVTLYGRSPKQDEIDVVRCALRRLN